MHFIGWIMHWRVSLVLFSFSGSIYNILWFDLLELRSHGFHVWKKKAKTCRRFCWFLFVSVIGQRGIGDGCEWWLQTQILGIESKKDTPIYNIQARWEAQADHCRKARRSLTELWGLHCKHPRKWVPICHLWLWLCNWRELPEKQNLFHCMVNFILFLESLSVFLSQIWVLINPKGTPVSCMGNSS